MCVAVRGAVGIQKDKNPDPVTPLVPALGPFLVPPFCFFRYGYNPLVRWPGAQTTGIMGALSLEQELGLSSLAQQGALTGISERKTARSQGNHSATRRLRPETFKSAVGG